MKLHGRWNTGWLPSCCSAASLWALGAQSGGHWVSLGPETTDGSLPFALIGPGQLNGRLARFRRADRRGALADIAFKPVADRIQPVIPAIAVKAPPELVRIEDCDAPALRLATNGENAGVPGSALEQGLRNATAGFIETRHRPSQDWRAANNSGWMLGSVSTPLALCAAPTACR